MTGRQRIALAAAPASAERVWRDQMRPDGVQQPVELLCVTLGNSVRGNQQKQRQDAPVNR